MANATRRSPSTSTRDIPLNKLVLSQKNVRRVKDGVSIEELAEDIARRGLIQSLNVRPVLDAEAKETGIFEVPAGGRRLLALQLLVKQQAHGEERARALHRPDRRSGLAEEDSLAENIDARGRCTRSTSSAPSRR